MNKYDIFLIISSVVMLIGALTTLRYGVWEAFLLWKDMPELEDEAKDGLSFLDKAKMYGEFILVTLAGLLMVVGGVHCFRASIASEPPKVSAVVEVILGLVIIGAMSLHSWLHYRREINEYDVPVECRSDADWTRIGKYIVFGRRYLAKAIALAACLAVFLVFSVSVQGGGSFFKGAKSQSAQAEAETDGDTGDAADPNATEGLGEVQAAEETGYTGWGDVDPILIKTVGDFTEADQKAIDKYADYFRDDGIATDSFRKYDEKRCAQSETKYPVSFKFKKDKNGKYSEATVLDQTLTKIGTNVIYGSGAAAFFYNTYKDDLPELFEKGGKYYRMRQFASLKKKLGTTTSKDGSTTGIEYWLDNERKAANNVYRALAANTMEFLTNEFRYAELGNRQSREQWGLPTKYKEGLEVPKFLAGTCTTDSVIQDNVRQMVRYTKKADQDDLPAFIFEHKKGKVEPFGVGLDSKNLKLFKKVVVEQQAAVSSGGGGKASSPGTSKGGKDTTKKKNAKKPNKNQDKQKEDPKPDKEDSEEPKDPPPSNKKDQSQKPDKTGDANGNGGSNKNPIKGDQKNKPTTTDAPSTNKGQSSSGDSSSNQKKHPAQDTGGGKTDSNPVSSSKHTNKGDDTVKTTQKDASGNTTNAVSKPSEKENNKKVEHEE